MSPELLEYGLRATTIWALLLAYYFLWGRKTSFRFQRILLLGGWMFGLAIPLLPALETATALPIANLPSITLTKTVTAITTEVAPVEASWQWTEVLPWLYLLGVLVFGARTLVQSWWVRQSLAEGEAQLLRGVSGCHDSRVVSPFAARGCVFMPEGLDPDLTRTALLHETAHLRARHHYDKTLMTISSILLWFHPLVWAYWWLLATIHEYEADAAVLQTVPARTYGLQLLHCSLGPTGSLGLFSSPLKQRIEMITSNTSKNTNRFFPMIVLALLVATLTFTCSDAIQSLSPTEETFSPVPVLGLEVTSEVDDYPRLVNGPDLDAPEEALVKAIFNEIRYPAEARKMAYARGVRATVVYGVDGTMQKDITMYRELSGDNLKNSKKDLVITGLLPEKTEPLPANVSDSVLLDEVVRTMEALGDSHPITSDGKPTSFVLQLDFIFQLEE